jgi:fermentation-respiration switch protein FrsA (DUF1100 family)
MPLMPRVALAAERADRPLTAAHGGLVVHFVPPVQFEELYELV